MVDSPNEENEIVVGDKKPSPDKATAKETINPSTSKVEDKHVSKGDEKPVVTPVFKPKSEVEKPKPTLPVKNPTPTPKPEPKYEPKPEPTPPPVEIPDYSDPDGWDGKVSIALTKKN